MTHRCKYPTLLEGEKTYTQAELDAKLSAEAEAKRQLLDQFEQLQSKVKMTDDERSVLDAKVSELKSKLLTTEEQARRERERTERAAKEEQDKLLAEKNAWRNRYERSTLSHDITSAAVSGSAFNPNQILAILSPLAKLTEGTDAEGNPNGEFQTVIHFPDVAKNGTNVVLQLSPAKAVERMRERDDFRNLFKDLSKSGTGTGTTERTDIIDIAKDPAKYREWRKTHDL